MYEVTATTVSTGAVEVLARVDNLNEGLAKVMFDVLMYADYDNPFAQQHLRLLVNQSETPDESYLLVSDTDGVSWSVHPVI